MKSIMFELDAKIRLEAVVVTARAPAALSAQSDHQPPPGDVADR